MTRTITAAKQDRDRLVGVAERYPVIGQTSFSNPTSDGFAYSRWSIRASVGSRVRRTSPMCTRRMVRAVMGDHRPRTSRRVVEVETSV